jgi:hypothetical protein
LVIGNIKNASADGGINEITIEPNGEITSWAQKEREKEEPNLVVHQ